MLSIAFLSLSTNAPAQPHLAQAWTAMSSGDGLPGKTGKEAYLFEDCKDPTDTCVQGHIFNYGEDTCVKYEINRGDRSPYTGMFYHKCYASDCCVKDAHPHMKPKIKKWDIGQAGKIFGDQITYLGKRTTTGLDNSTALTADAWNEVFKLPFSPVKINYTYYVTVDGNDTITHRIDYSAPGDPKLQAGHILYGNFTVQHDLEAFRDVFKPPAACLKPNILKCPTEMVEEWERNHFSHSFL